MVGLRTLLALAIVRLSSQTCSTDLDCRLNGICSAGSCVCDAGWTTSNCGALDIRPGPRSNGYNHTGAGISSWGAKPMRDPKNSNVWHAFIAEFANGCSLDGWSPYSQVIRGTSDNPLGPFVKDELVISPFSHNPTVVWDEKSKKYLLYHIGCPQKIGTGCNLYGFQCSVGNDQCGESGLSVRQSSDLVSWPYEGNYAMPGLQKGFFDSDTTNPSAWPLQANRYNVGGSHRCSGSSELQTDVGTGMLMAYRGSPYDQSYIEQIALASGVNASGDFARLNNHKPIFNASAEDPSIWRDKRGNWHIIMHALEPGFRGAPNVGTHAYSKSIGGPWYYDNATPAFTTAAQFNDGSSVNYYRRERPQLVFTDDGNMTPIVLVTGVQETSSNAASYTLAVPIGDYDSLWNTTNCY